jgi:flagellar motor switch protein FliM
MAEILNSEEIDQFITAINSGDTKPEDFKPIKNQRKIEIYDFKRPDKFSKEQIRNISLMHDTFARLTTNSLTAQLRSIANVKVASVDQLTYNEFIRSIPSPTTLAIINMDPLKGNAVMEIDPQITFAIIDRICGGIGDETKPQHELTDIEQSIMENIIVRMLGNLREAWTTVLDLRPRLGQIDTRSEYAMIVPETEMVVLITLEIEIGDVEGMINICVPYLTVGPIIGRFSSQLWYSSTRNSIPLESSNYIFREDIPICLTAEILMRNFPIKEILKWDIGTVIQPLISIKADYCYLKLGDRRVWQCQILPDNKCFPKRITIVNYAEKPFGTEGNDMTMEEGKSFVTDALNSAMIKISVELGCTKKPVKEVFEIGEGTILELDKYAGEPVDILANGVHIAKGEMVVIDENFGVRITEIEEPSPEPPAPQMSKKAFADFDIDSFNESLEKAIKESLEKEKK